MGAPVLDRGQRRCSGCAGAVVAAFFVALTVAFWKRSWPWGVVVLNAGTLLKVTWSVAFGGEAGWASLAPSIFTLVVTDAAILLAVGLLRRHRERQEGAARDGDRSHDTRTMFLSKSRT